MEYGNVRWNCNFRLIPNTSPLPLKIMKHHLSFYWNSRYARKAKVARKIWWALENLRSADYSTFLILCFIFECGVLCRSQCQVKQWIWLTQRRRSFLPNFWRLLGFLTTASTSECRKIRWCHNIKVNDLIIGRESTHAVSLYQPPLTGTNVRREKEKIQTPWEVICTPLVLRVNTPTASW